MIPIGNIKHWYLAFEKNVLLKKLPLYPVSGADIKNHTE